MQYEAYENKIKKVASVLAVLWRHIVPILLCTAALAAVVTAITVMKGTIISVETHDVFEYGEKLDLGGKAFFGRVRFEYSADNSSWTDEQPNMPGEYRARAFALDSFGNRNYGDEFAFVIKRGKLSIVCKENTLVYGDKPTPLFEGLAKGDTVKGVRFSVDSYHRTDLLGSLNESIATAVATPNIMNLDIVNSEGEYVTGAYDIDALPKQVNISRRSEILQIKMKSAKKVYDGLPLDSRSLYDITQGTLVDGDILLIEQNSSSIVDVQKLELAPANVTIYDSMRENVTFLYNIEVISATLEITPRPLYIETESAEFTYDGKLRTFPNYKILKGDLVYGDSLKILSYRSVKTVSEDGAPYKNEMYFSVVNSYGNEVSDNYDIKVDFGEITVNKCPITIATGSSEKEWDGRPLSNKEAWIISNTDLAVNHNVTISGNPTITMIGRTKNTCDESLTRITLSNGEVVTNNFIIQGYQYGTLNVKQGPQLCVMVYPTTKTYSGKKISVDLKDVCVPIAEGKVTIDYSHINVSLTDSGTYTLGQLNELAHTCRAQIDGVDYPVVFVGSDASANPDHAVLTVTPKVLSVSAVDKIFNYKADAVYRSDEVNITKGALLGGHTLTARCNGVIECVEGLEDGYTVDNFITYCQITDNLGRDMTHNYQIEMVKGYLAVIYYDDL